VTYDEAQEIHEQLQDDNPQHDRSSCVCCCADCDELNEQITT
jgi:hypothetical protein